MTTLPKTRRVQNRSQERIGKRISVRSRLVIATLCVAVLPLQLIVLTSEPASAAPKPSLNLVVMGDSYSAGNGAGDFFGPAGCYRSKKNWASLYGEYLQDKFSVNILNVACSGATTQDILSGQDMGAKAYFPGSDGKCPAPDHPDDETLTYLRDDYVSGGSGVVIKTVVCQRRIKAQIDRISSADILVLTMGGNNVNFDEIVKQCFIMGFRDPDGCETQVEAANAKVISGDLKRDLISVLSQVKTNLRPDAKVALLGYPFLEKNEDLVLRNSRLFGGKSYDAGYHVREFGRTGDRVEREAFQEVFGGEVGKRAFYILEDVKQKFAGPPSHEPCARGNFTQLIACNDQRWVHEAYDSGTFNSGKKTFPEWYHPNTLGHGAYRDLLMATKALEVKGPAGLPEGSVDVVFVIDTTGSMGEDIAGVKTFASQFVDDLSSKTRSYRVALVDYRDFPERSGASGDYPSRVRMNFTNDKSAIQGAINDLSLGNGGDFAETVWSGLKAGVGLPWRPGVKKVVIQIGDAPPLDPEPISGLTGTEIVRQARAVDPANVYAVDVSSSGAALSDALRMVVVETDGRVITSSASTDIGKALEEIVRDAVTRPFAFLNGPYVAKVGDAITLDGSGSFDNDGSIVKYEWDLNGDAKYDVTTNEPTLRHVFDQLFDGFVGLRVTDDAGFSAEATAITRVTSDGDETPDLLDNCPADNNPGQEDFDADGVGDVCDETSYPVADKDGVELSLGLQPVSFTVAGRVGASLIYATGSPNAAGGTDGKVIGVVRGQRIPIAPITEAGMTIIDGAEVLLVRFKIGDAPWELRYRSGPFGFGLIGTIELCGPPGCETGAGVKFNTANAVVAGFDIPTIGSSTTTSTTTLGGSTTTSVVPGTTTTIAAGSTTTTTVPISTTVTTTRPPSRCATFQTQVDQASSPQVRAQLIAAMRALGCPVP